MRKRRASPGLLFPVFIGAGMLLAVVAFRVFHLAGRTVNDASRIAPFFIGGVIGLAVWSLVFFWRETYLGDGNPFS